MIYRMFPPQLSMTRTSFSLIESKRALLSESSWATIEGFIRSTTLTSQQPEQGMRDACIMSSPLQQDYAIHTCTACEKTTTEDAMVLAKVCTKTKTQTRQKTDVAYVEVCLMVKHAQQLLSGRKPNLEHC
jgi:hypothetical protein